MESKQVLARCLKTYPDEDDTQDYFDGKIAIDKIKIYYKGKNYKVSPYHYDKKFYKIISKTDK